MGEQETNHGDELKDAVQEILRVAGTNLRVAAPLGIGKPHRVLNAIYRRVAADKKLSLKVHTALSLSPPFGKSDLERRFLGPFVERFYGEDFERLEYVRALQKDELPPNIHIEEFYMQSGEFLSSRSAQRSHTSINYTHVARGVAVQDINVLVQKVAREPGGERLSLSCNPDLTLDLIDEIALVGKRRPLMVAEVDPQLPWIDGAAAVEAAYFDIVIDLPRDAPKLFALPRSPISDADYAIGLYASALVKDGGTLQIGIGALSDALAHALVMRHRENAKYLELLEVFAPGYAESALVRDIGGTARFEEGLYGASEMVNDAFRVLRDAGVLVRRVVDDVDVMERVNAREQTAHDQEQLEREGRFLDGAFYLGSVDLYRWLRELSPAEARGIGMTRVSHINHLYGDQERLERAQRKDARFFNTCMLMTALGAAASETLDEGRVVSGVGGQYNFVAMAHELRAARSVLMFRATHGVGAHASSNIRWNYGNITIPRHLRDIAITEYGVADLRDRSDEACALALIAIAGLPFQAELMEEARRAKKFELHAELARDDTPNVPEFLAARLAPVRKSGLLPDYPHGSDFTPCEQRLVRALGWLQKRSARRMGKLRLIVSGLVSSPPPAEEEVQRMGWNGRLTWRDKLQVRVLRRALLETAR